MADPGTPILVDRDRCIGTGNCMFYAERTFDLADEGWAVVIDPNGDPADKQRMAVENCPTGALSFEPETPSANA